MYQYHLFISHSWKYNEKYEDLLELLDNRPYFDYRDYSVPIDDPLYIKNKNNYREELKEGIINQLRTCSVMIVIAGEYVNYSDSIYMEMDIAIEMGKPIIAVQHFGAKRIPSIVELLATEIVKWNSDSIVDAIRRLS